jgi:nitrite reductase/ring-hydroxylating ferredoxin subunit
MSPENTSLFQTVCHADEIVDGGARMFRIDDAVIGIYRIGNEYFAMENECPHAGASLAHGIVEGDQVSCRIHHWRFLILDGTYLDEDKPTCNRKTYRVRIADDHVQVLLPTIDNAPDDH